MHMSHHEGTTHIDGVQSMCMGDVYYYGLGVPQNSTKAKQCYRLGADAGDTYCLGMCHLLGIRCQKRPKKYMVEIDLPLKRSRASNKEKKIKVYLFSMFVDIQHPDSRLNICIHIRVS